MEVPTRDGFDQWWIRTTTKKGGNISWKHLVETLLEICLDWFHDDWDLHYNLSSWLNVLQSWWLCDLPGFLPVVKSMTWANANVEINIETYQKMTHIYCFILHQSLICSANFHTDSKYAKLTLQIPFWKGHFLRVKSTDVLLDLSRWKLGSMGYNSNISHV